MRLASAVSMSILFGCRRETTALRACLFKKDYFWPKINVLGSLSKFGHRIFLISHIWSVLWVYLWNNQVKSLGKIRFHPSTRPSMPLFGKKSTSEVIPSKWFIEFCWFLIEKLVLWSSFTQFRFTVRKNMPPPFCGLFVPNWPFSAPNQHFSLYVRNGLLNLTDFYYRRYSYGLLSKNLDLQPRKIWPRLFVSFLVLIWSFFGCHGGPSLSVLVHKIQGDNYILSSWNFIRKCIGPSYVHWTQKTDRAQRDSRIAVIFTADSPKYAKIGNIWKQGSNFRNLVKICTEV